MRGATVTIEIPIPARVPGSAGVKVPYQIKVPSLFNSSSLASDLLMKNLAAAAGANRISSLVGATVAAQLKVSRQPTTSLLHAAVLASVSNNTAKLASAALLGMPKLTMPLFAVPSFNLNSNLFPQGFASVLAASPIFEMQKSILSNAFAGFDFKSLLTRWYPRNWPEDVDFEVMRSIAIEDGIPVIWVTPTEVTEKLATAEGSNERLAILLDYRDEIMETCRAVLDEIDAADLYDVKVLAQQALQSLVAGTFGPAQAMSVTILDSITKELNVNLNSEPAVRKKYHFHSDDLTIHEVIYRYTMAPFIPFARPWHPLSPLPKPTSLSRHVTIHRTDLEHYNPTNALVAVMLVTSVLRTYVELLAD
jgi:hypothetical protein